MSNKIYMFCKECTSKQLCEYKVKNEWFDIICTVCKKVLGQQKELCYNNEKNYKEMKYQSVRNSFKGV